MPHSTPSIHAWPPQNWRPCTQRPIGNCPHSLPGATSPIPVTPGLLRWRQQCDLLPSWRSRSCRPRSAPIEAHPALPYPCPVLPPTPPSSMSSPCPTSRGSPSYRLFLHPSVSSPPSGLESSCLAPPEMTLSDLLWPCPLVLPFTISSRPLRQSCATSPNQHMSTPCRPSA
jgi:hypothetical protein